MIQFSYSFCMATLHSFWQAALLVLLYMALAKPIQKNNGPLAKRNFLYAAIMLQLVLSVFTFSFYFFGTRYIGYLSGVMQYMTDIKATGSLQMSAPWLFSFYIFVISYRLIKAIYSWHLFKQQYRSGLQKPSIELKVFTELKCYQFGITRKVKLWASSSIQTPITFGFFKPIILLPIALLNNINTQQAETLILHELTHIRTNDFLLNWFLLTAETIFFFNPFIKGLCERIRLEREKNCDLQVMAFEYSPALYAETLLLAERMKQPVLNFQLAAANRKKHLLQRIQFFTNNEVTNPHPGINRIVPLLGLILGVLLSMGIVFNSGHYTTKPNTGAVAIPLLPVGDYVVSNVDFGRNKLPAIKEKTLPAEQMETKKQGIENPVNNITLTPLVIHPLKRDEIEVVSEKSFATPVTLMENNATTKEIIIQEESSGSISASVKIYQLRYENGVWILQPEWIVRANEFMLDSLSRKLDTLSHNIRRSIPAQQ